MDGDSITLIHDDWVVDENSKLGSRGPCVNVISKPSTSIEVTPTITMYSTPYAAAVVPFSPERPDFCALCQTFHSPMAHIMSEALVPV